jgi:hypothetical protein
MTCRRPLRRIVGPLFGCGLFSLPVVARAQVPTDVTGHPTEAARNRAEEAFWEGKRHYDSGEFDQALQQFQEAYRLVGDPDLVYDIAQTNRRLGNCSLALEAYRRFVQAAPVSPRTTLAEEQITLLKSSCLRPDAPVPTEPSAATKRGPVSSPAQSATSDTRTNVERRHPQSPEAEPQRNPPYWAIATLVAGVVAGGTAAGLELWNQDRYRQWKQRDRALAGGTASGETPSQWLAGQRDNDRLWGSIQSVDKSSIVLGVGAGALVAASAVLYFASPNTKSQPASDKKRGHWLVLQPVSVGAKSVNFSVQGMF